MIQNLMKQMTQQLGSASNEPQQLDLHSLLGFSNQGRQQPFKHQQHDNASSYQDISLSEYSERKLIS